MHPSKCVVLNNFKYLKKSRYPKLVFELKNTRSVESYGLPFREGHAKVLSDPVLGLLKVILAKYLIILISKGLIDLMKLSVEN